MSLKKREKPIVPAEQITTPEGTQTPPGVPPFHPWRRVLLVFGIAVVIFSGIVVFKFYSLSTRVIAHQPGVTFFGQVKNLLTTPDKPLQGEEEGRTNILIMGFGGAGHDGAYLTDTMIVASLNPTTKEVAMISIPRDLYVEIPGYGYRKINNAFAFGRDEKVPDGGENLAQATVQQTLGIPIHYYAWIDFSGFEKIIDDIGGIDVTVENAFVDYQYPTSNYGYQTIKFSEGLQHMDGDTALKYVRSRHGTNGEGSDFARSRRQQQVILAVRKKLLGFGTLANPSRVNDVLETLANHMRTNMQVWEALRVAKLFDSLDQHSITNRVFDTTPGGMLASDYTPDGAYILRPKSGSFAGIQYITQHIFEMNALAKENAKVQIIDATTEKGYGKTVATDLEGQSITVVGVDTAGLQQTTRIYDASGGAKPKTIEILKEKFRAEVIQGTPSTITKQQTQSDIPDIYLMLGADVLPKRVFGGPIV